MVTPGYGYGIVAMAALGYGRPQSTQAELKPILSQISLPWQRGSVEEKCNWQYSMAHPRKPPYRRKNLAKTFYAKQVIANFVSNFVAMATGVGRGKK